MRGGGVFIREWWAAVERNLAPVFPRRQKRAMAPSHICHVRKVRIIPHIQNKIALHIVALYLETELSLYYFWASVGRYSPCFRSEVLTQKPADTLWWKTGTFLRLNATEERSGVMLRCRRLSNYFLKIDKNPSLTVECRRMMSCEKPIYVPFQPPAFAA